MKSLARYVRAKKVSSQQIPQTFRSYCTNPCVMELPYSLFLSYDVPINFSAFLVDACDCNSVLLALILMVSGFIVCAYYNVLQNWYDPGYTHNLTLNDRVGHWKQH